MEMPRLEGDEETTTTELILFDTAQKGTAKSPFAFCLTEFYYSPKLLVIRISGAVQRS
jgi:hypothetical protein